MFVVLRPSSATGTSRVAQYPKPIRTRSATAKKIVPKPSMRRGCGCSSEVAIPEYTKIPPLPPGVGAIKWFSHPRGDSNDQEAACRDDAVGNIRNRGRLQPRCAWLSAAGVQGSGRVGEDREHAGG